MTLAFIYNGAGYFSFLKSSVGYVFVIELLSTTLSLILAINYRN